MRKRFFHSLKHSHTGVTLIELLVVVAIIGVIATIGFVALTGSTDSANDVKRISDVSTIQRALDISRVNNKGNYEALKASVGAPAATASACAALDGSVLIGTEIGKLLPVKPKDPESSKNYYIEVDANVPTKYRIITHLQDDSNRPSSHLESNVGTDLGVGLNAQTAQGGECDCTNQPTHYCVGSG